MQHTIYFELALINGEWLTPDMDPAPFPHDMMCEAAGDADMLLFDVQVYEAHGRTLCHSRRYPMLAEHVESELTEFVELAA